MVVDLEKVGEMDASEFHAEKLNAKEVRLHKLVKVKNANRRWNSETFIGGNHVLRTPL